ncbi:hypothetical protein PoB_005296000 [Plakobranchus ocellatus]|uniref:Uncharacterized protein n=1 Tax=Plakobranchus ocellatus TaxID=259542 RepID=A0AAV4C1B8_9GAST|nr:hypothetical protein PoB_005296000 [Plakobranchus ocellatus]
MPIASPQQTLCQARRPVEDFKPLKEGALHISLLSPSLKVWLSFVPIARPQQCDLRLSGFLSGQEASGGIRTHERTCPADLRAGLLSSVPPTPLPSLTRCVGRTHRVGVKIHWLGLGIEPVTCRIVSQTPC